MNRIAPPISMAETLLADSLAGILVYEGHSGNCIFANQAIADMLGGSVGALRLQNFRSLACWRRSGLDDLAEAVLLNGLSKHHEVTLHTDFGRIVSLECFISRFDFEGRPHLLFIVTDLTERERAQAKLTRERALLRCLIDSVSDLIFIKDRDGVYRGCNRAGEDFIGMPEWEQIGKTDVDFFGREKAEQIRKADCRVLEEGKPLRVEEWVTGHDGRRLLMDTIKAPYYDPGGEALGLVGIGRDITDRKLAEQELKEQLHFLQQLIDSIPIPVYYKDTEGLYLGCNAAFEAFTGLVRKDIVGKTVHEVVPKERADKHHYVDLALLSRPGMQIYEVGGIYKDGKHHDVIFSKATFVDANDRVAGTVGALMDITERKQAERERLANLRFFESMDRVNRTIQGADDLEAMMRHLLDEVLSILDCDRAFLMYPCDPEAPAWYSPMERNKPEYPGVLDSQSEMPMDQQVAEALRALLAADGPVTFGPGMQQSLPEDISKKFSIQSVMAMAIYPKTGSPWQFGIQQCDRPRIWTAEEKRLFQEIGRRLTDGLSAMLAEKALRESEKKLREAARIAHVGYWERDYVAQTIVLSEEACKIFGLPPHQGLPDLTEWHTQWVKLIHPEDQHQAAQAAADALAGGPPYNVNYRVVRSDGQVRCVHSYAEVTRDASGNPLRMFGTMIDITERRQAEEKMLRSDQRLRFHREQSPLGFLEWDENFHAIEWNAACERIFGYTREEAIGRHAKDLILHVEVHELVDGIFHGLMNQTGGQHSINENVTKDGRIIICEWFNTTLIDKDGKAIGIASICNDITEQKRMEMELAGYREQLEEQVKKRTTELETARNLAQQYLDIAGVILVAIDKNGRVTLINQRGCDVLGYTSEEIFGKDWFDTFVPEIVRRKVNRSFRQIIAGELEPVEYYENPVLTRDGRERLVAWHNVLLRDRDGDITGTLSSGEDITERKHAEEQIIRLNRDLQNRAAALEAANKDLDAFAYSVSHDLRAPLRHIDGFMELLQKRAGATLDEKSRHFMDTIVDSAQKMGLLIDDLLAFSRMGRQAMSLRQVGLGPLVRDVIRELEPETAGRHIVWRLGELPVVKGDASLLRIVLGNLISNAVKFTRKSDQARIEVGCQLREKESIIFIRDNGAGFDPAYAGNLFGVFQRLHHKDEFEGTGVGLAIVQRIIIRHGGRTWAEGQVGRGATFYFSLPRFEQGEG